MSTMKRWLSILLALTLLVQMFPLGIFADEPDVSNTEPEISEACFDEESESPDEEPGSKSPAYVVGERMERRGASEKHFLMSDGSCLAVMFDMPIHYQDAEGTWQDFDNTLNLKSADAAALSPEMLQILENAGEDATVYEAVNGSEIRQFAADLDESGYLFTAAHGNTCVSMSIDRNYSPNTMGEPAQGEPESLETISAEVVNPVETHSQMTDEEWQTLPVDKQVEPEKYSSWLTYENIWEDIDFRYQLNGADIKECIFISSKQENYDYLFRFSTVGLEASLSEDKSIALKDAEGTEIYRIPAPFMADASGEMSELVEYKLEKDNDDYLLYVSADASWINAEERAFPVVIDPSIEGVVFTPDYKILTSYVSSERENHYAPNNSQYLMSGYYHSSTPSSSTGHGVGLVYVNDLPTVPKHCFVTNAYLELSQVYYDGTNNNTAHKMYATTNNIPSITHSYLSQITWNNFLNQIYPKYVSVDQGTEKTVVDFAWESGSIQTGGTLGTTPQSKTKYYITGVAQKWYDSEDNSVSRLLVIDDGHTSTTNARVTYAGYCFRLTDTATVPDPNYKPRFYVSYRDATGIDSIYGYHTQDIGRAGTGYVNNYTLNTTLSVPIVSCPSETLPFTLSLVYNGSLSNGYFTDDAPNGAYTQKYSKSLIGYGWKLSVQETIKFVNISSIPKRVYIDADGTEHFFTRIGSSSTYRDEEGLGLVITGDYPDYMMTDMEGNTWDFYNGYLTSYTTATGNALYYCYNGHNYNSGSTTWKPSGVSPQVTSVWRKNNGCDNAQKLVTITYDTTSFKLTTIKDAANRETAFTYSGTKLTTITFPDGDSASYSYSLDSGYQRMAEAIDNESHYKIAYSYWTAHPLRVYTIREYTDHSNTGTWTPGQRVNCFICNATYSRFRYFDAGDEGANGAHPNGRMVTRHYFDSYGRTINVVTMNAAETVVLGASAGTYTENDGTSNQNNRLTSAASAGIQSRNLLNNSGLEDCSGGSSPWRQSGTGELENVPSEAGILPHTGTRMRKISSTSSSNKKYKQSVTLKSGKTYVFSGYVNTSAATNMNPGRVFLEIKNNNGTTLVESIPIDYQTNSLLEKGWVRLECSFTSNEDADYWVAAVVENYATNVLVDDFQLEEIPDYETPSNIQGAASTVELLQLGGFEKPTGSYGQEQPDADDWWTLYSGASLHKNLTQTADALVHSGKNSLKLSSNVDDRTRTSQVVKINDTAAKTYILSAWGLTPQTNYDDGETMSGDNSNDARFFGVIAKVTYASDNNNYNPDYFYLTFSGDINEWQYATALIVPKHSDGTISSITVYPALDYSANTVYIDDISLKADPVQTYQYNSDGQLIAATNSEGQTSTEYDNSGRLTKYTNMAGVSYTLAYNGSTRHPKSITSDGVVTSYTYNTAGSVINTKIKGTSSDTFLQTSTVHDDTKNFVYQSTDSNGYTTYRTYNINKGTLAYSRVTGSDGNFVQTNYTYNSNNDRINTVEQPNTAKIVYTYYLVGTLAQLNRKADRNGNTVWQAYSFAYDRWGRTTSVKVKKSTAADGSNLTNGMTLVSYQYNTNGTMSRMSYPNGDYVLYGYDVFDRLVSEVYYNYNSNTPQTSYYYVYNSEGNLAKQYEVKDGTTRVYSFEFDSLGRLIRSNDTSIVPGENNTSITTLNQRTEHRYDTANRLTSQRWSIGDKTFSESYTYNSGDGSLKTMQIGSIKQHFSYDTLKRLSSVTEKTMIQLYSRSHKTIEQFPAIEAVCKSSSITTAQQMTP